MNHLAHSILGARSDAAIVGQLLGDFVRGPVPEHLSPEIAQGVRLHRHLDVTMDAHAETTAVRELFQPPWRRVSGIGFDLWCDHLLVRHWEVLIDVPLDQHLTRVHRAWTHHLGEMPSPASALARFLIEDRVLERMGDPAMVGLTLQRLAVRHPRLTALTGLAPELARRSAALEKAFVGLWPDLVSAAQNFENT